MNHSTEEDGIKVSRSFLYIASSMEGERERKRKKERERRREGEGEREKEGGREREKEGAKNLLVFSTHFVFVVPSSAE